MVEILNLRPEEWHNFTLITTFLGHVPLLDIEELEDDGYEGEDGDGTGKMMVFPDEGLVKFKFSCCESIYIFQELEEIYPDLVLSDYFSFSSDPHQILPGEGLEKEIWELNRMGYRRG